MAERCGADGARLRLGLFLGAAVVLGMAEALAPARARRLPRGARWPAAAVLAVLAGAIGRALPLTAAARFAERRGWGLLNRAAAPPWVAWPLTLVVLDGAVWAQHVLSHALPPFWRLHRAHHSDPDVDISTGVRFHPAEIALSSLWKAAVVLALGAPPGAALAFEAWLSTGALFSHANLRLPRSLESALRRVAVTPASHRLHHRTGERESRVNFGFGLSLWDQLFGTFDAGEVEPGTPLGVGACWRRARDQHLLALLSQLLQPRPAAGSPLQASSLPGRPDDR